MTEATTISVEVAYALPGEHRLVEINVAEGTTALEAALQSDMVAHFPDLTLDEGSKLGVFGHIVAPSQVLSAGDRVEIYRPLKADPKEVRKARAARAKERRASGAGQDDSSSEAPTSAD